MRRRDSDENSAMLHAGSDDGTGTVTEVKALGVYHRPPFAIGFYGGFDRFELADGVAVMFATYVGPATNVALRGTNAGRPGSSRWSAHPELRLVWAAGITGGPTGVATDARGTVLESTTF